MRYVLGLDIGIASVGWAVLALDSCDEPYKIVDLNSRIFPKAENPKDGASLALPRRLARGNRRRLRRRRHRMIRIKKLICRVGMLPRAEMDSLYDNAFDADVYTLRSQGLERMLSNMEWARVLIHIAKHRGFKSNRKSIKAEGDDGKVLMAVNENKEILKKYRTVGEMFAKDEKFLVRKRNTTNSYILCVSRDMLIDEVKALFEAQRSFGNNFTSDDFRDEYLNIFASQRSFDEGPGGNSPYGGNQIENMIGWCTFERENGEKRAPKASYSFMEFNLLQKLNHLRVKSNKETRNLNDEERQKIIDLAWKSDNLTFKRIRKEISLPYEFKFTDVYYKYQKDMSVEDIIDASENSRKFNFTAPYHQIRKALDSVKKNRIKELTEDEINAIAYAFTVYKTDTRIKESLENAGISEDDRKALLDKLGGFSKFGHLSIKACKKINTYLKQGLVYSEACTKAGYDFKSHVGTKTKFLDANSEEIREIKNPVVRRALSQTMKVVNSVIRKYGSPVEVHIEMAREMSKNFKERNEIQKIMDNNRAANEKIKDILSKEYGIYSPTGMDIIKYKLYQEQNGICPYSQTVMDIDRVFHDEKYVEIDHILPYSRSFDDSFNNKVLVKSAENQNKRNRTPMEYMQDDEVKLNKFVTGVKALIHNPRKVANLLRENFNMQAMQEWKSRNLNDTKYISRFVFNFFNDYLELAEGKRKRRIVAVNGAITSYIRKRLGINKIRENGDTHHAVDAVIIASITQGVVNRVNKYSKWQEVFYRKQSDGVFVDYETGEIITKENFEEFLDNKFPEPWAMFRKELEARVSLNPQYELKCLGLPTYTQEEIDSVLPLFVSRMPNRKTKGSAHKETVRSPKMLSEGCSIVKTDIQELKLSKDKTAIENYYAPESDRLLYNALLEQLQRYDGKGKEAFKETFYKPKKDGSLGAPVRKVKTIARSNLNVSVNGGNGIADNGDMVRVDVFYIADGKDKGYYLVPIYVADTKKAELPSKAVVANKSYAQWKNMEERNFIFSLYPNDLVYIEKKSNISLSLQKGIEQSSTLPKKMEVLNGYFYYKKTGIGTASITIISHDNVYSMDSLGVKSLKLLRKCDVDILGNKTFVRNEKRQYFR